MKSIFTILLLILSNVFMTIAWYGHLKYGSGRLFIKYGIPFVILVSWGIALFEYCFQVPANKLGFKGNGGPFSLVELKVIQEVISLLVFVGFTLLVFKEETIKWNHLVGFFFLVAAVFFVFKR